MARYTLRIHHELGTLDIPHQTYSGLWDALRQAIKEGFWVGDRFYPARCIVYCERFEEKEDVEAT